MASLLPSSSDKKSANNDAAIKNATLRLNVAKPSQSLLAQSYADTGNQSIKDQAISSLSPLMNLAGAGLNVISRPGQAVLHSLNAFSGVKPNEITGETLKTAGKEFIKGLTDIKGTDNYNLRRTMNQDPNAGGRLAGLFDTIGSAAIDPTTFVTGGTKAVGQVGLKVIESKLGTEIAESVAKQGIKSVGKPTQAAIKDALLASEQAVATKGGADKFTQDVMDALYGGKGVKFAGKTVLKYDSLAPAVRAAHLPQALDTLKSSKAGDTVRKGFIPMAKVTDLVGSKVANQVEGAIRKGRASGDNAAMDVLTQVRTALKDSGMGLDDIKGGLTDVLNGTPSQSISDQTGKLLSALEDIRSAGTNAKEQSLGKNISSSEGIIKYKTQGPALSKILPASIQRVGEEVQPTLFGQEVPTLGLGRDINIPQRTISLPGAPTDATITIPAFEGTAYGNRQLFDTHQLARSITKEAAKAISRNPTQIARALGLDASATPANIIKHLQSALPNESLHGANERLSSLVGVKNALETNPIKVLTDQTVRAHRDAATADTLKGLMKITDESGKPVISTVHRSGDIARETVLGTVYGPKEILDELDHAAITLTDDHALKEFGTLIDKWGKLWRGYATVPVLFGLGFHERNFVGNVFNMWLLGFRSPQLFNTSDKILRAVESGTNKGLTADDAIEAASKLAPEERQWVRAARSEGVISDSFFRTDQATAPKGSFKEESLGGKLDKIVGMNGPIIRSGAYVGRRIEDNSRLAMFIDQMRKHGDPQIAAENVKKALFDYSELTPTEKTLKKVIPFYTYMRKNTPLQVQSMLQNPGKFATIAHAQDNLSAAAPDTDGKPLPQYALANGAIPLVGGDTPIIGSMALPYQAAAQQIQPLLALASQAPGVSKNLKTEGGSGDALRQVLSNFGGGPADLAKLAVEQATGKSLYTGQDIKAGTGLQRTAKALIPLAGKGDSTITDLTSDDPAVRNARLLAGLSGLSTTAVTENRVEGEKARRAKALQTLAKGTPTIAELRKQGKAPKVKRTSVKKTKSVKPAKKVGGKLPKAARPKS